MENRQRGGIWGLERHNFSPMAGELSPDMMLCVFLHEIVSNECKCINITKNGRNGTYSGGGEEKREKNSPKWTSTTCFAMYDSGTKYTMLPKMSVVCKEE